MYALAGYIVSNLINTIYSRRLFLKVAYGMLIIIMESYIGGNSVVQKLCKQG